MNKVDPEYVNTWRATPALLWSIAIVSWLAGSFAESWLPGSIAASGGIAIALTAPLLGISFAKQSTYELDLKLALVNLRRENNRGAGVLENLPDASKPEVAQTMAENNTRIDKFEKNYSELRAFSGRLLVSEIWIISVSSALASLGNWIGNVVFHCGSLIC